MTRAFSTLTIVVAMSMFATPKSDQLAPSDGCIPGGTKLKELARDLRKQHPSNDTAFINALDKAVQGDMPVMMIEASPVIATDALYVLIQPPYGSFRFTLEEKLRKFEPIEDTEPPPGFILTVSPRQIDAPDIIKVIVEKNGMKVEPVTSAFAPTELITRMGAKATLHAGSFLYPCSAFTSPGDVRITAIPNQGQNFVKVLPTDNILRMR